MIQFYFSLFTFAHIYPITKKIVAMENDIDRDITFTTKGPNIIAFAINDWPPLRIWARAVFTIKSRAKRMQKIAEAVKRPFLFLLSFFILILLKEFLIFLIFTAVPFAMPSWIYLLSLPFSQLMPLIRSLLNLKNRPLMLSIIPCL